jgi:hypothetical protein
MRRKSKQKPLIDGAGHLDPKLLQGIRERAQVPKPEVAFIDAAAHSSDALAEHMGEAVIEAITSGQDDELENQDTVATEEIGGPFVETPSEAEMAEGTDESNIEGATRNPFPTT